MFIPFVEDLHATWETSVCLTVTDSPRVPDLDGPVTRGGHDVLLVEVDDIDRGSVTDEHPPEVNFGWRDLSK